MNPKLMIGMLWIFDKLVLKYHPILAAHLTKHNVANSFFWAFEQFLCLFCSKFPFTFTARIIDIFLHEGEKILFRVGLMLLKIKKPSLLKMKDEPDLMQALQRNEVLIDFDEFFERAHKKYTFSRKWLRKKRKEYDE